MTDLLTSGELNKGVNLFNFPPLVVITHKDGGASGGCRTTMATVALPRLRTFVAWLPIWWLIGGQTVVKWFEVVRLDIWNASKGKVDRQAPQPFIIYNVRKTSDLRIFLPMTSCRMLTQERERRMIEHRTQRDDQRQKDGERRREIDKRKEEDRSQDS